MLMTSAKGGGFAGIPMAGGTTGCLEAPRRLERRTPHRAPRLDLDPVHRGLQGYQSRPVRYTLSSYVLRVAPSKDSRPTVEKHPLGLGLLPKHSEKLPVEDLNVEDRNVMSCSGRCGCSKSNNSKT